MFKVKNDWGAEAASQENVVQKLGNVQLDPSGGFAPPATSTVGASKASVGSPFVTASSSGAPSGVFGGAGSNTGSFSGNFGGLTGNTNAASSFSFAPTRNQPPNYHPSDRQPPSDAFRPDQHNLPRAPPQPRVNDRFPTVGTWQNPEPSPVTQPRMTTASAFTGAAANGASTSASLSPRISPTVGGASEQSAPLSPPVAASASAQEDDESLSKAEESLLNKIVRVKLLEMQNDEVLIRPQHSNPESPLFSVKTFQELRLKPAILKAVFEMGFTYPSKIQETALPVLLAEPPQNMIAQSQSGTGKTAAFVLTMLSRIRVEEKWPQALCISPTYELALQIGAVVELMGKYMEGLSIAYAVRGERVQGTKIAEQIVIGTPGTICDWILKYRVFDPSKIRIFVLDEADVMIAEQGHQDQSIRVHRTLNRESCQMLLFSATYDDAVMQFAERLIADAVMIRLKRQEMTLSNIKQFFVDCASKEDKYCALANIYGGITIGQSMIFCHTKDTAEWLAGKMCGAGLSATVITSNLTIEQRAANIRRFKDGKEKVLITTNVCARGIDVEQVTMVVNFDLPLTARRQPDFDAYLHRIGRTGRFGKIGIAINFIDGEQSRQVLQQIQKHFGRPIDSLDASDIEAIENIEK